MAILSITEYSDLAQDAMGRVIQVGYHPAVTVQTVTYTTSTAATAFNGKTKLIRVIADADAYINIQPTSIAATATSTRIEANVAEYFGVHPGHVLQVYDGTS